jgi:hypothetical protein
MRAMTGVLQTAIERREWEAAALCLLVAVAEAANRLPPEALEEMLELLAADPPSRPHHRARRPPRKRR